ncbi:hypothetical protein BpHYR1_012455 [Brachionus plicatilis]|uniref:Uncharacterized protein n=1 Tax=Brachionus plicatilis TaxID=10195 RepID=A0A3M7RK01_BRAPC|nr:hypothetical protein BpHYR1_012455 [Brachionus plicatilis]
MSLEGINKKLKCWKEELSSIERPEVLMKRKENVSLAQDFFSNFFKHQNLTVKSTVKKKLENLKLEYVKLFLKNG